MRKRRFLTQKAAFYKEENAALFSAYQRQPLFLRVLRERFSQDMYPKRRFWIHIAIDMYSKRRFWVYILQVFCGFEISCRVVVLRVLRERFEDKMKIIS